MIFVSVCRVEYYCEQGDKLDLGKSSSFTSKVKTQNAGFVTSLKFTYLKTLYVDGIFVYSLISYRIAYHIRDNQLNNRKNCY